MSVTEQTVSLDEFQAALLEDKTATENEKRTTLKANFLEFVQKPSFDIGLLVLIYLDIIAQCLVIGGEPTPMWSAISQFATAIIAFEISLQVVLFHDTFFSHFGYLLDTTILLVRLGVKLNPTHFLFLNFLKAWRFARLVNCCVSIEKGKQSALRRRLELKWKKKAEDANEETETLRAALRFAAEDLAAAKLGKASPEDS